jgi:hypothetical protein
LSGARSGVISKDISALECNARTMRSFAV